MIYPIRHSSVVLLEYPQLKSFTSKAEAQTLLQQFNLDKETLSILIQEGDWQTSPGGWGESKQTEKLAELILADKMVITQRKAGVTGIRPCDPGI